MSDSEEKKKIFLFKKHEGANKGGEEERGPSDGKAPLTPPSAFLMDVSCEPLRVRVGQEGGVWIPQRMLAGTAKSETKKPRVKQRGPSRPSASPLPHWGPKHPNSSSSLRN